MKHADRSRIFCSELQKWFTVHKRSFPWRDLKVKDDNHRAYLVLVSEIMLQQTQVSRVIVLYKNFIQKFPLIEDLAAATNAEVILAWRGLGYNSRALRLRDAARAIAGLGMGFGSGTKKQKFPREMHELLALPGIGPYTAGAIRNFAFDLPTPCIDTNIRRILHRCFIGSEKSDGTWKVADKKLLILLDDVMSAALTAGWAAKDFYAALMDFGSLVCTKNNPKWHVVPDKMKPIFKAYGKQIHRTKNVFKKEPGREIAGRFIPNRIFRGRIVEALRDHPKGLTLDQIGKLIAIDYTMGEYREWLGGLLKGLQKNEMLERKKMRWMLRK